MNNTVAHHYDAEDRINQMLRAYNAGMGIQEIIALHSEAISDVVEIVPYFPEYLTEEAHVDGFISICREAMREHYRRAEDEVYCRGMYRRGA